MNNLSNGSSREDIIDSFARSEEFSILATSYGIIAYEVDGVKDFVERFYTNVLRRSSDTNGLDSWSAQLENKTSSAEDIVNGFFTSQEFINQDTSDSEFIDIVYRTFFDREADDGGFSSWLSKLSSGMSRDEVIDGFLSSSEFEAVASSYGIEVGDIKATTTTTYNLREINKLTNVSALLKGGYSNGVSGSLFIVKTNAGNDYVNGMLVTKISSNTSITLDNGYTSQASGTSKIDTNGATLAFDDTLAYCTLITTAEIMPINAEIGDTSTGTSIYSCDDSTNRTMSWRLTDAGNGNAYYILDTVMTGALQSENTTTIIITPENKVIYLKVSGNLIAEGITFSFEGAVN
ncbi:MAG: hypothetical protein COB17_00940 [Sulfurimonas sp.]|nr:MAG: hypothetical protein COB17_00940 [Sulfurimonas sp.]